MMSSIEYMYWQNRKDRVSEYICVRASGASEQFFEFLIVLQLKRSISSQYRTNLRLSILKKCGGIFVQATPRTPKIGEYTSPSPGINYASDLLLLSFENLDMFNMFFQCHNCFDSYIYHCSHCSIWKFNAGCLLLFTASQYKWFEYSGTSL